MTKSIRQIRLTAYSRMSKAVDIQIQTTLWRMFYKEKIHFIGLKVKSIKTKAQIV